VTEHDVRPRRGLLLLTAVIFLVVAGGLTLWILRSDDGMDAETYLVAPLLVWAGGGYALGRLSSTLAWCPPVLAVALFWHGAHTGSYANEGWYAPLAVGLIGGTIGFAVGLRARHRAGQSPSGPPARDQSTV
jgi:hypothetical protein